MANKHMTDGSASLVIRKMQIKATTIFLDAHPGAAGMTKPDDPRCRQSECSLTWDREQKAAVRPSLSADRADWLPQSDEGDGGQRLAARKSRKLSPPALEAERVCVRI